MDLSLDYFTECLKVQQKTAQLFNARHLNKYKYSSKYLFEYDDIASLWVEIEEQDIKTAISNWLTSQKDKIIMLTPNNNEFEKKKIETFEKLYETKTNLKNIDSVYKFFTSEIKDNIFINNLNRAKPHLLPIKNNKVVDLKTGEIRRREPEDYFTYFCNVEPTTKKSELFNNFIKDIMCRNQEAVKYLQSILGYSISGDMTAQSVFIMWGNGSNGKSVLLNLISEMMGDAYKPASKSIFLNIGKAHGEDLLDIKDRRIITYSETADNDNLNEEIIKMISGGDMITARGNYKSPISFKLISKLLLITNNKPKFNGNDYAMIRRIKFLPFQAKFVDVPIKKNEYKKNINLEKELIKNHLDEFFSFCLEGSINYFKNNKFEIPKHIGDLQQEYLESQGNIEKWYSENIVPKPDNILLRSDTYNNYKLYCDDNAVTNIGKSSFFEKMKDIIGEPIKKKVNGMSQICYVGFTLISDIEKEANKKEELKKIDFRDEEDKQSNPKEYEVKDEDKISLEDTTEEESEEEPDPEEMKIINYKLNNKK
jgi:putative DNA primase/helicase